jgi:hypothetical protein
VLLDYLDYQADLNALSQSAGALCLTIPMLYLEGQRR